MAVQLSSIRPLKVFVFLPLKSSDSYSVSNNITQRFSLLEKYPPLFQHFKLLLDLYQEISEIRVYVVSFCHYFNSTFKLMWTFETNSFFSSVR